MYNFAETMMPTVLKPEKKERITTFQTQAERAISESNVTNILSMLLKTCHTSFVYLHHPLQCQGQYQIQQGQGQGYGREGQGRKIWP